MRDVRQVIWGIATAFVSIALLLGIFSLSLAEGNKLPPAPTLLAPTVQTPTLPSPTLPAPTQSLPTLLPTITLTSQPSPSLVDSPTFLPPTRTFTLTPSPTICPPPPGWKPYIVRLGDTLDGLALRYKKTSAEIRQANCLVTTVLVPGLEVYLPPLPTRTPTPCGAPQTWINYIVQQGDTLYHLGQVYGIPYMDIQRANCLTSSDIRIGQHLFVPPWPTRTPSPTSILFYDLPSATWADIPTFTDTPTPIYP